MMRNALSIPDILRAWQCDERLVAAGEVYEKLIKDPTLLSDIEEKSPADVVTIIKGAQSIDIIHHIKRDQAEALRKMMLAMVDDIRSVILKLAERLFLITHVQEYTTERQKIIAQETMDFYAPLANRLGMGELKWRLEDGAFACLQPEEYQKIVATLQSRHEERERIIHSMTHDLKTLLEKNAIKNAIFSGRVKHIYSIYKKLVRKEVSIENIYDASAIRIVMPTIADCYTVLSLVHERWAPIAEEFDDYIAKPKPNGYQSIHTAVLRNNTPIEIQIRTQAMHTAAEMGIAAHWSYKENKAHPSPEAEKVLLLRELLDWQKNTLQQCEALYKKAFHDHVYVFSPLGDVYDLPQGATPLDFAYSVHTSIGHRCRGAKVNGAMVALTTTLKTGDRVDILTTKEPHPSHDWIRPELGFLKTSRAISKVKHWYRKTALETIAHTEKTIAPTPRVPVVEKRKSTEKKKATLKLQSNSRFLMHVARCCNPKTGEDIIGYITQGRGISIHQKKCPNMQKAFECRPEKLIEMDWEDHHPTA